MYGSFLVKGSRLCAVLFRMVSAMRYVVIYDVSDDNLRTLVAETLKDYGLQRIQYSGFMGDLRRDELNSLARGPEEFN